jgi:hypothetical protein
VYDGRMEPFLPPNDQMEMFPSALFEPGLEG